MVPNSGVLTYKRGDTKLPNMTAFGRKRCGAPPGGAQDGVLLSPRELCSEAEKDLQHGLVQLVEPANFIMDRFKVTYSSGLHTFKAIYNLVPHLHPQIHIVENR